MQRTTLKTVLGALMIGLSSGLMSAQQEVNTDGSILAASSGDTNPVVELLTPDPTALIGTSTASFTLVRTGRTNDAIAIGLTFTGTATNGVDFAAVLTTVSIPAGELAIDIRIQPLVVSNRHGNKTVKLSITNTPAFTVGRRHSGTVTLIDDVFTVTNAVPTVSILSPTNGTAFAAPQDVPIKVQWGDLDDTLAGAVIYGDGRQLGTVTSSPGSITWSNPGFGRHTIVARVLDAAGQRAFAQATFTVLETLPKIWVTAPKNGTNFHAPATIEIAATASTLIKTMEFWFDGRRVGESVKSPYQYTVTNVRAGFHTLYAVGVDSRGKRVRSATIYISVSN